MLKLETAAGAEVFVPQSGRKSVPAAEFTELMRRRLASPHGYPALGACLMPEDRVAVPLAPGVPEVQRVLAGILEYLFSGADGEIFRGTVTVLRSPEDVAAGGVSDAAFLKRVLDGLSETAKIFAAETVHTEVETAEDAEDASACGCGHDHGQAHKSACGCASERPRVTVVTHTPQRKERHALLGASAAGESLVVSRELFDADFILPVGVLKPDGAAGYDGVHSGVYPLFSDEATQTRFAGETLTPREKRLRAAQNAELSPAQRRAAEARTRQEETRDVTRLLGIMPAVMVLPNIPRWYAGAKEMTDVADVLVGTHEELDVLGAARYRRIWRVKNRPRVQTVVASVTGGPEQQTWENVSLALANAAKFVDEDEDATIFLATDITAPLGPAMQAYRRVQVPWMSLQMIRAEKNLPDADAARRMIPLLHRYQVYFISPLDRDLLHELNISCLERRGDLRRLVARSASCAFLPDAQRVSE